MFKRLNKKKKKFSKIEIKNKKVNNKSKNKEIQIKEKKEVTKPKKIKIKENKAPRKTSKIKTYKKISLQRKKITKVFSAETRKKLSQKRRARAVQPNQGKGKHTNNIYSQLIKDYTELNIFSKKKKDKYKEAVDWLKDNKDKFIELGLDKHETSKAAGFHTDCDEVFLRFRVFYTSDMLYDPEKDRYAYKLNNQISDLIEDMDSRLYDDDDLELNSEQDYSYEQYSREYEEMF